MVKLASNRVQKIEEDTPMQSSPFMSSSMPNQDVEEEPAAMRVMTVVREEHLEGRDAERQLQISVSSGFKFTYLFHTSGEGKVPGYIFDSYLQS